MKRWKDTERMVWSCRLCAVPEEDETAQLEEELRDRRLHYVEDALALQQYIRTADCSQEEAARRLGRAQSTVANRLRLLKLPQDVLAGLRESALTERHGRALLRLETPERQREALETFRREKMSVAEAEAYVEAAAGKKGSLRCSGLQRADVLLTSLNKDLDTLRRCGVQVTTEQKETENELVLIIHIFKKPL